MPAFAPGSKILVSGANGYIAIWVVRVLLERGYAVRGTVRAASKGTHLSKVFAEYGDKFEVVVVEDITKDGAFDEAVKGVDAIAHTASPFHFKADDPQELIVPAVHGTVGILQSALKHGGPAIKRVVITSSCAAVLHVAPTPQVFSEADWNEQAIADVEKNGKAATPFAKYRASRTLAEKAAWEFYEKHKSAIPWDLAVLNPPFVFGPVLHDVPSADALNQSVLDWYKTVAAPDAGGKDAAALATQGSAWIDVRDLAEAHALALEKDAAGGERIIVAAGPFVWQDWLDAANTLSLPHFAGRIPRGNPGAGRTAVHAVNYDTAKAARILGLKYHSVEETTRDSLADFAARGF